MGRIKQVQGRKSQIYSYAYQKSIPAETIIQDTDDKSTAVKMIDKGSNTHWGDIPIYGQSRYGLFVRVQKVRKVDVVLKKIGNPSALRCALLDARTLSSYADVAVAGVGAIFGKITVDFGAEYTCSTYGPSRNSGFYVLFYQTGNGGDASNYYLLDSGFSNSNLADGIYSPDAGTTYKSFYLKPRALATTGRNFDLDGSTSYMTIADAPNLKPTSFTIEMDVRLKFIGNIGASYYFLLEKGWVTSKGYHIYITPNSRIIGIAIFDAAGIHYAQSSSAAINDDEWHHLVFDFNGATYIARLFIDNVQVSTFTGDAAVAYDTSMINIGRRSDSTCYANVEIGSTRFYNAVLSDSDRLNNYQKPQYPVGTNGQFWIETYSLGPSSADLGTGSEGDVVISTNTSWNSEHNCNNLTINSGITLTLQSGAIVRVKQTMTVNGTVSANGQGGTGGSGAAGGNGPCIYTTKGGPGGKGGDQGAYTGGSGGSFGGGGGGGADASSHNGYPGGNYGGGGGSAATAGAGGAGGGRVKIYANSLVIAGTGIITSSGNNAATPASSGGGGGGAGQIEISTNSFTNSGTVRCKGGNGANAINGGSGNNGGGGGGGGNYCRIGFSGDVPYTLGTYDVSGGTAGTGYGTGQAGVNGSVGSSADFAFTYAKDLFGNNNDATPYNVNYSCRVIPYLRVYNATTEVFTALQDVLKISNKIRVRFTPSETLICTTIGAKLQLRGSLPTNVKVDLYTDGGSLLTSGYISVSSLSDEDKVLGGVLATPQSLTGSTTYYCVFSLADGVSGDEINNVRLSEQSRVVLDGLADYDNLGGTEYNLNLEAAIFVSGMIYDVYINQNSQSASYDLYGNNRVGQTFIVLKRLNSYSFTLYLAKTGSPPNLMMELYAVDKNTFKPTGSALASSEISASAISGAGAYELVLSYPMMMNTYYALVLYCKGNGGDGSNKYSWYYATTNPIQGNASQSSDAGLTWTLSTANDMYLILKIPREITLFTATVDLSALPSSIASTTYDLDAKLYSLDGRYVTLRVTIDGSEQTDCGADYNGTQLLQVNIIPAAKIYPGKSSIAIVIYAAGSGLIDELDYGRTFYFDKTELEPADFGAMEMVLWDGKLEIDTLIQFNDDPAQFILNPEDVMDALIFDTSEAPREIIVRKIKIVKGRCDLSFLGM